MRRELGGNGWSGALAAEQFHHKRGFLLLEYAVRDSDADILVTRVEDVEPVGGAIHPALLDLVRSHEMHC